MEHGKQVRVVLGGHLARRFGAEWNLYLDRPSPAEAVRAIDANLKGELRRFLYGEGAKRFYKVAVARKDNLLGEEELRNPSGVGDIYILPTVRGSEKGLTKILVGVALIAAVIAFPAIGGAISGVFGGGITAGQVSFGIAMFGASLVLGGITQLITPTPSFDQNSAGDSRGSNVFNGNAATVTQGGAVGLVYGRMLVSPMPISLSFTAFDQTIVNSFAPGEYTVVQGAGGVIDYVPNFPGTDSSLPEN